MLTATRVDVQGSFSYRIEMAGSVPAVTRDPVKAARMLRVLGVEDPLPLVEHARLWGSIEIIDPPPN